MALCFGCRFLITQQDEVCPRLHIYRCKHFPRKVIGILSGHYDLEEEEEEYPQPVARRCYRPEKQVA
jgi:hypothetical protein